MYLVRGTQGVDEFGTLVHRSLGLANVVTDKTDGFVDLVTHVPEVGCGQVVPLLNESPRRFVPSSHTYLDDGRASGVLLDNVSDDGVHAGFIIRGG